MPLPADPNTKWPPRDGLRGNLANDLETASAWYGGDPAKLACLYGSSTAAPKTGWRSFWSSRSKDEQQGKQAIHVPAASDVAQTAADLLFGETPLFAIPEAHEGIADDEGNEQLTSEQLVARATEERLAELIELDGIDSKLLEAAEIASGLRGVYLRVLWDDKLASHPMLDVVHPDQAVPDWSRGHLVAVTFWREVGRQGDKVWRHLERYEPGVILHGLYLGSKDELGIRVPLEDHAATRGFDVDDDGSLRNVPEVKGLMVRYVPNVLPDRRNRASREGRSDTAGLEGLMDSLDRTMTAWMREIDLVKPRVIVPSEFLERKGRGKGATFDIEGDIYSPLEMDPKSMEQAGIKVAEFSLHTEEYESTCRALFGQIVQAAGYSPDSFGVLGEGGQQTATEVNARTSLSDRTTAKKQRYWRRALADIGEILLIVDQALGSSVVPMRPQVIFQQADSDLREMASSLNLINLAQAASAETKVRMLHPSWDEPRIQAEAKAIRDEFGVGVPDPTGGFP